MKTTIKALLLLGAGLAFTMPAVSAQGEKADLNQFKACAQIKSDSKRLTCFDEAAAVFDFAKAKENLKEAATLKAEAAKLREENKQRRLAEEARIKAEKQREADLAALALEEFGQRGATEGGFKEFKSTVVATKKPQFGGVYIKLDNGHIWQNIDKTSAGSLPPGSAVTIKETNLGGFFMIVESSGKSVRIKRVN
ncbi:hypothetical protein [Kordiimonas sp.]|uniref:hypothetical protein n=1 Tax=Kordiimonas sp. TaxID=1970157 RepID=UPI003A956728